MLSVTTSNNKEILGTFFQISDLIGSWRELNQWYDEMFNFRDKISDEERLSEYIYIVENFRKFVFTKQDEILKHDTDWVSMQQEVQRISEVLTEKPKTRRELVYQAKRDDWLRNLIAVLGQFIEDEEEELNNGW